MNTRKEKEKLQKYTIGYLIAMVVIFVIVLIGVNNPGLKIVALIATVVVFTALIFLQWRKANAGSEEVKPSDPVTKITPKAEVKVPVTPKAPEPPKPAPKAEEKPVSADIKKEGKPAPKAEEKTATADVKKEANPAPIPKTQELPKAGSIPASKGEDSTKKPAAKAPAKKAAPKAKTPAKKSAPKAKAPAKKAAPKAKAPAKKPAAKAKTAPPKDK